MLVHASLRFKPQRCVKGHWEHGKTPVEMDLLSHKYSPATFHPAGEKLPNGHLCNLSLQNLNIGEQETLIHAFLRLKAIRRTSILRAACCWASPALDGRCIFTYRLPSRTRPRSSRYM